MSNVNLPAPKPRISFLGRSSCNYELVLLCFLYYNKCYLPECDILLNFPVSSATLQNLLLEPGDQTTGHFPLPTIKRPPVQHTEGLLNSLDKTAVPAFLPPAAIDECSQSPPSAPAPSGSPPQRDFSLLSPLVLAFWALVSNGSFPLPLPALPSRLLPPTQHKDAPVCQCPVTGIAGYAPCRPSVSRLPSPGQVRLSDEGPGE